MSNTCIDCGGARTYPSGATCKSCGGTGLVPDGDGIDHLSRPVLIHCCKDRTLSYRTRCEPIFNGVALPVFSVDSKEEAEALLIIVGRRQYVEHPKMKGRPWFKVTLDGALDLKMHLDLDDLPAVTAKLAQRYALLKSTAP